jgi:hypothetical protein
MVPAWPPAALAASPLAAAVQLHRFLRAARLLAGVMAFRELLGQRQLLALGLARLVQLELLPNLRAAAGAGPVGMAGAVGRAEAVVGSLPAEWFAGGGPPPPEAAPLVEVLAGWARWLEAGRGGGGEGEGVDRGGLARRLAPLLARLGGGERAQRLAAAYGFSLTQQG